MWRRLCNRIRFSFARARFERDLAEEMEGHRALLEAEKLREGLSPEEAAVSAHRQFGNTVFARESSREIWSFRRLDALFTDVRCALRTIGHQPGMAAAAILALAIGIGACAATWSLISALLLHPLPVKESEKLFWSMSRPGDATSTAVAYPTYKQIQEAEIFDGLAANGVWWFPVALTGASQPRPVCFVSHDYFNTLGVQINSGRNFSPDDDRRTALPTAIISHRLWSSAFFGDRNAIGRTITIGGVQAAVIGIAPREFLGLDLANPADIYMPLHAAGAVGDRVTNYFSDPIPPAVSSPSIWIGIAGRLRPGMTADETARRLNSLFSREPGAGRWTLTNVNTMAVPMNRSDTVRFSQLLAMTVGLILLIGCLSTGMLLLVRTEAHNDEFAMRLALGASRARLVQGIVVEGAILSLAGAALAVPVSDILLKGLQAFELPGRIQISSINLAVDGRVLAALGFAAVAACMLIALVAAVYGFSVDVGSGLRARAGATRKTSGRKTRSVLVAAHVAVALVLLSGAGLWCAASLRHCASIQNSRRGGLSRDAFP